MYIPKSITCNTGEQQKAYEQIDDFLVSIGRKLEPPYKSSNLFRKKSI